MAASSSSSSTSEVSFCQLMKSRANYLNLSNLPTDEQLSLMDNEELSSLLASLKLAEHDPAIGLTREEYLRASGVIKTLTTRVQSHYKRATVAHTQAQEERQKNLHERIAIQKGYLSRMCADLYHLKKENPSTLTEDGKFWSAYQKRIDAGERLPKEEYAHYCELVKLFKKDRSLKYTDQSRWILQLQEEIDQKKRLLNDLSCLLNSR